MARINWLGTEIQATLVDQLPNGNYRFKSQSRGPRIEPGTIIEVTQDQVIGLNVGNASFLAGQAAADAASLQEPQVLTRTDAGLGQMPPPGPAALGPMFISSTTNEGAKIDTPPSPQSKGTPMGTPLVEIKGLGNAITSVRSGLAGVRALAADVQVSAGALHAELTDVKQQIEDARAQIKTEASIMGNSGS